MRAIPLDTRVKLLQAFAYLGFAYTVIWQFNIVWFLLSFFLLGWFMTLVGVSCGLHKYSSHKNFEAKNKIIKFFLLFFATIMSLGSTVAWSSTHRKHHQTSDTADDPHSPNVNSGLWRSIKLWFYYFPTYHVSPRIVKDLTVDPLHKFFHKHYFKIVIAYVVCLALVDIKAACYFYFVPVIYGFQATSYITVLAHNPWLSKFGYRNFSTSDRSFNSKIAAIFCPCDGNHNNHHARAGAATNSLKAGDWDTGYWFIKLIGRVPDQSAFKISDN